MPVTSTARLARTTNVAADLTSVEGGIIDVGAFELVATTFNVVAGEGEGADANPGDGICANSGGDCTLRAAVSEANALADHQTIVAYLPATTPCPTQPQATMPT